MIGRRFASALKQDPEARKDFAAFLLERRTEIHKQLESETHPEKLYRLQGKIAGLDEIQMNLDALLETKEEPTES